MKLEALARVYPDEFGRCVERPLPVATEPQPVPGLSFPMQPTLPNGAKIDAMTALCALCNFPHREKLRDQAAPDHESERGDYETEVLKPA